MTREKLFGPFECVFFDVDGTLVDVFPVHVKSYLSAFRKETGIQVSSESFFLERFKLGDEKVVWESALESFNHRANPRVIKRLVFLRQKEFKKLVKNVSTNNIFPRVIRLLESLKNDGKRLFVFSGNSRKVGELILQKTGLAVFFEGTFFADDAVSVRDKASLLLLALKKTKTTPGKALVVGDSVQDFFAARKNKTCFVGVCTGLCSKKDLKKAGAKIVLEKL